MAGRDASRFSTAAMMSMTGLAGMPGMAVLPTCSIGPVSHGARTTCNSARSVSNFDGQSGSYTTISTGASPCGILFITESLHWVDSCGAARRNKTGTGSHREEGERYHRCNRDIVGPETVEQRGH